MIKAIVATSALLFSSMTLASDLSYTLNSVIDKSSEELIQFEVCEFYKGVEVECKDISKRSYSFQELEDVSIRAANYETSKKVVFGVFIAASVLSGYGFIAGAAKGTITLAAGALGAHAGSNIGATASAGSPYYGDISLFTSKLKKETDTSVSVENVRLRLKDIQAFERLLWEIDNCRLTRRGRRCDKDFVPTSF